MDLRPHRPADPRAIPAILRRNRAPWPEAGACPQPVRADLHLPGGTTAGRFRRHGGRRSRPISRRTTWPTPRSPSASTSSRTGNWKLTIENNRECYHCGGHPELLCSLFHFFGYAANDVDPSQREYFERFQRTQAEFERIWDSNGLAYKPIERLSGRPTAFRTERLALDGPGESYTMDARSASRKLINGFTSPKNRRAASAHPAQLLAPLPGGPQHHLQRAAALGREDAGAHHLDGRPRMRWRGSITTSTI